MTSSHSTGSSTEDRVTDLITAGTKHNHVARSMDLFNRALRLSPSPTSIPGPKVTFSTGANAH